MNSSIPQRNQIILGSQKGQCQQAKEVKQKPIYAYYKKGLPGLRKQFMPYIGYKVENISTNRKNIQLKSIKIFDCLNNCWKEDSKFLQYPILRDQIPGKQYMSDKALLAKSLQESQYQEIAPITFVLPEQTEQFLQDTINYKGFYIVKPVGGLQGRGIIISQNKSEIIEHCNIQNNFSDEGYVVQHYINNPALHFGRKFDLRVYLLITNTDPLTAYFYENSMIRFATEQYKEIEENNIDDIFMHLTNYHIGHLNKNADQTQLKSKLRKIFKELVTDEQNKNQFNKDIQDQLSVEYFYEQLKQTLQNLLLATYPGILNETQKYSNITYTYPKKYYGLYGVDLMLTTDGKFQVLEINSNPSFIGSDLKDSSLKIQILQEMYDILGVMYDDIPQQENPDVYQNLLSEYNLTNQEKQIIYQLIDEQSRINHFVPIYFDNLQSGKYNKLINKNKQIILNETQKEIQQVQQSINQLKEEL